MENVIIPEKLYGRDKEISGLKESFENVSRGNAEVLLVSGDSGAGKTALINELRKPVKDGNGFFIGGKYEQFQQNVPYFAFRQALAELCLELQTEDEHQSLQLKSEILQALGSQGQVLIDLVPEFESFLGKQPTLTAISPQEARYRFAEVLRNFLSVICRPEHPLVLFIDDWQWAGIPSFELLKQLQVGKTLRYLLVIMAYRGNEITPDHRLITTIEELNRNNVPINKLKVQNISISSVSKMLKDTLKSGGQPLDQLANITYTTTKGNPFFVKSLISLWLDSKLLWFDEKEKSWKWKIEQENDNSLPKNLVDLFSLKLKHLDLEESHLLSLAACLGNRFNIENLSIISGIPVSKCLNILSTNQVKEFVVPMQKKLRNVSSGYLSDYQYFIFQHDRMQQAAFSIIKEGDLAHILLKSGNLLIKKLTPEQFNDRIFEITNNLNAGFDLIVNKKDRIRLIDINIRAARKAYAAAAYSSALQYYINANRVVELPDFYEYFWEDHYELAMSFFKEYAQCQFLEGDQQIGEKCIDEVINHSQKAVEKVDALNILIIHHTLHARYPEAINSGKAALKMLGIDLPDSNYDLARDQEIASVRQMMKNLKGTDLGKLPVMSNPEMLMACKILITIGPPCYRSHQKLWSVIVPTVVGLTLKYGNIPQVGYSHTAFGGLLGYVSNDFETAKIYSNAATDLMTKVFRNPSDQSVFYLMIGSSIRHWFKHLKYGSQDYIDAYEIGLQSGNLQYAAYAFGHNMYCRFYQGIQLDMLISETKTSLEFSLNRHNQWAIDLFNGGLKAFNALITEDPENLFLSDWDDLEYLKNVEENHNIQVICIYKVLKTFSLLLAGKYEKALELSTETEPIIYTVGTQGLLPWPEHVFARFLIISALFKKKSPEQQEIWNKELGSILNQLKVWAETCPENFEHKYYLAAAEMARIEGHSIDAAQLYARAAESARDGHFLQWQGMANERASLFWTEFGNEQLADSQWQMAYECYTQWGALAKVKQMELLYKEHLLNNMSQFTASGPGKLQKEQEFKRQLADNKIEQIRNYAFQIQQSKLRHDAISQANELAQAMQKLRSEIARRKKTEEELRQSEERFHSLFSNMNEGVALHELVYENGQPINYRIVDVNLFYEQIIGKTRQQSIGTLATELYETQNPPFLKEFADVAVNRNSFAFEIYFDKMDKHFAISVAPWRNNGFATIFTDITERKLAEEVIRNKNMMLEKMNSEKDKYFSIIAHDLRNPFTSIMGLTQLLANKVDEKDDDAIKKYAEIIRQSTHKVYDLLINLMEWSKTQTGRMVFNPQPLNMNLLIHEVILLNREVADQKSISISSRLDLNVQVSADKAMISTVLRNLVSNAIKFTHPGGNILISTRLNQYEVVINVKDTGVGMNQSKMEKLFRIDQNTSTPGTQNEKGTGLGLILCKEFVEKHGGKMWFESTEEDQTNGITGGSVFSFSIPKENVTVT
jgi:predicted ATPase/signal transduction histidine kinase